MVQVLIAENRRGGAPSCQARQRSWAALPRGCLHTQALWSQGSFHSATEAAQSHSFGYMEPTADQLVSHLAAGGVEVGFLGAKGESFGPADAGRQDKAETLVRS